MKKIKSFCSTLISTLGWCFILSVPVLADQCSYISKEQGIAAISRLNIGQTISQLCEPCGEAIPQITTITNLSLEKVDYEDFWQVVVNGEGIDLAYVFVDSGIDKNFANLAAIANCPATEVSPVLPTDLQPKKYYDSN